MKLLDLRKVRLITKTSVAAAKQPRIELPIFGISIGTEQSRGDTSRVSEAKDYSDYDQYIVDLHKKHKLKALASGKFAVVYQHPKFPDVAVKVVKEDTPYIKFLEWSMKQKNNPWLPKILSIHHFHDEFDPSYDGFSDDEPRGENWQIVFMERLNKMTRKDVKNFLKLSGLYEIGIDAPEFGNITDEDLDLAMKTKSIDPHLKAIFKYVRGTQFALDIHDQNIMVRDDGQLVITDPTSYYQ
jgi:hypothetical protein